MKDFNELLHKVRELPKKKVVIAAAQSHSAIEAAIMAKEQNIAEAVLVGDGKFIVEHIKEGHPQYQDEFEIIDTGTNLAAACKESVNAIKCGRGELILKGKADTATLIKAVLDKQEGLRTAGVLSDVLVYEHPERLMLMSDGGIIPYPELKEKISIINNAVKVAKGMGIETPKVALLAATEGVKPKMQCTVDAAIIAKMNQRKQIGGCLIDGPLAFDNAISEEAAKMKGINSPVAGKADVLIVPNIEAGNIFGKTLTYYCRYRVAHVVMGAKVPVLIASRADDAETKMLSIALGTLSVS